MARSSDDSRQQRRQQEHAKTALHERPRSTLTQIRPRTEAEETLAEKKTPHRTIRTDVKTPTAFRGRWSKSSTPSLWTSRTPWIEDCVFQLNTRKLKVEEQTAFAAAKELRSISNNSVRQFCDEINQERTMKARFILKWSTGADGQQEAKAPPVLQGFRDLHVLSGRLGTNSPTASRLAGKILQTIAATEDQRGTYTLSYRQTPKQCWASRSCRT